MRQIESNSLIKMLDVARKLAGPSDLVEMLELVISSARQLLNADRGSLFLCDLQKQQLYSVVAEGEKEIRFNIESGIAGECACKQQIITVNDCYGDERFNQAIDQKTGYHTESMISIPLVGFENELMGVLQLLNAQAGLFNDADVQMAEILASQAGVAIQRARLLDDRITKIKLERDLDLARDIQLSVLPSTIPACTGYDVAVFSRPADQTGGDIYDLARDSNGDNGNESLMVLLADATGHGIGPALSVTQFRAMFRMGHRLSASMDQLTNYINHQLFDDLPSSRFITAFIGRLDTTTHQLTYHAPGQGPLLHYHAENADFEWRNASTIPLGLMDQLPDAQREQFDIKTGDVIVLLTDGFYEYQNPQGKEFGKTGVQVILTKHHTQKAQDIIDAIVNGVEKFSQGAPQGDDLTAIVIKRANNL